ncbi:MAG: polyphenol oxidase family protein [Candidatus Peregrinibacteria bacterium]|nr:polyphenol oxidase family protein [Candidatus Peregrinibacteria bacterium]MCB9807800.1 polyphenol oxidase family protein [Candidatus Peribacteria bacterium]
MIRDLFPQFQDRIDCRFLTKNDRYDVPEPRVRLHQVHGNRTIVAREPIESTEQADGVITDTPGLHLMVRAADCQNFAVYAPGHHVCGVLHAGWRGILAGAIPEFFTVLERAFGIEPYETFVAAGPSMCLACAEYKDPDFELRKKIDPRFVHDDHVDLQGAATMQLLQLGLPRDHFARYSDCTTCHPKTYVTYRGGDRERVEQGGSNVLIVNLV